MFINKFNFRFMSEQLRLVLYQHFPHNKFPHNNLEFLVIIIISLSFFVDDA